MDSADGSSKLLTEIAQTRDAIVALERQGECSWVIVHEEGPECLVEWFDNPVRIVLSSELGAPSDARRLEVSEALLCYNALWRETRGVRVALGGTGGPLLMVQEIHPDTVSHDDLAGLIGHFGQLSHWWSVFVQAEPGAAHARPAGIDEILMRV